MNAPSSVISESIDAVEALAQCISKLNGPMRLAATADAHRVIAKAAANLNLGPDATFLWKQAHVAELQRLVEKLTVSAMHRDMNAAPQSALDVADRLAAYIVSLPIELRPAATAAAYDAIANASNMSDSRIAAHQHLALRLGMLAERK